MSTAIGLGGSAIWYEVIGPGRGRMPLLLIQGLALDHHGWDSALDDFADRPVVVLDHRGTGASGDAMGSGWSTRDFARDVVAVLDAAGIPQAHVYGHSMGGRIAQWLGATVPDRIGALVLGATTVGDHTAVPRSPDATQALASGGPDQLNVFFYSDSWLTHNGSEVGAVAPSPTSSIAMRRHLEAVAMHDGPAPEDIAVPTLVLHGVADRLAVVANAELLATRIPDVELFLLEHERHVYWAGRPEAHRAVADFLRRHE